MKLNAKPLFVMALMVGSLVATGCSRDADAAVVDTIAPEESVTTAPVQDDATMIEKDERRVRFWAPRPPAVRWEERGRAPSDRHFWAPGYWRWNGREHLWHGGHWALRRDGFEFVAPHWQAVGNRWEYLPGRWVRRG